MMDFPDFIIAFFSKEPKNHEIKDIFIFIKVSFMINYLNNENIHNKNKLGVKMEKFCKSCGMPMDKPEDFASNNVNSDYCYYCGDEEENKEENYEKPSFLEKEEYYKKKEKKSKEVKHYRKKEIKPGKKKAVKKTKRTIKKTAKKRKK